MKMERRDFPGGVGGGGYRNCYYGVGVGGHYDHHHSENAIFDLLNGDVYDDVVDDDQSQIVPRVTHVVNGANYIEHHVSRMDTLAGVAIKYGVEVADIKKMNSLVTDLQMFAVKTLHIPLTGRHPPSPCLSNGSESPGQCSHDQTPQSRAYPDFLDSFQSVKVNSSVQRKVSPAMSTLQGFYGLKSTNHKRNQSEGFEMALYQKEDGPSPKQLMSTTNPPLNRHRKSKSLANGFFIENGDLAYGVESAKDDSSKWIDNMIRRGRRPDSYGYKTPEIFLKEDPSSNSGGFSAVKGKALALRSKATSRSCLVAEDELDTTNSTSAGSGTNTVTDHHSGVRKSLSTPSLQDQESCTSSMWLSSKWNFKTDLQALSAVAIARPIFDGLPKPMTGRKNKPALD